MTGRWQRVRENDAVFVTAGGDRFGPRHWRIGSAGPAAATAALDQARARIDELTHDHRQAAAAWASAQQAHRAASDAFGQARRTAETLRHRVVTGEARQAAQAQASQDRAAAQQQRRSALTERRRAISQRLAGHESSRTAAAARLDPDRESSCPDWIGLRSCSRNAVSVSRPKNGICVLATRLARSSCVS